MHICRLPCLVKVLHVEEDGEDFSYHFVQLFDGRGRDLAEILRQQMDESQPMNTQLMTETTPPLPPEVGVCIEGAPL